MGGAAASFRHAGKRFVGASGNRVGGSGRIGGKRRVSMRDPHAIGSGCRSIGMEPQMNADERNAADRRNQTTDAMATPNGIFTA